MNKYELVGLGHREDINPKEKIMLKIPEALAALNTNIIETDATFNSTEKTRDEDFLKRHNFRVEETFDLDFTFATWLYEHLVGYVEVAEEIVDLSYHSFIYEGVEYNQREMIEKCLNTLTLYFNACASMDWFEKDYLVEAAQIWALLVPAMWW